ncbi:hypothetical protein ACFQU7_39010 [Pseudoroseomonas wenyumeiae]
MMTFPGLRSTVLPALLALGMALSAAAGARAATAADPDWPCVQRLVPNLTAAGVWSGPVPPRAMPGGRCPMSPPW